jgi:secretion/DNA translocation related TadE-like protein
MTRRARRSEQGAGSILILCAVAVVLTALLMVVTLAAGYHARHRAAAAADLAALAAAGQVRLGAQPACDAARRVADANGGMLRSCVVQGWDAEVTVAARIVGPTAWLPDPVRRARAGPAVAGQVAGGVWRPSSSLALPIGGPFRVTARFGDAGSRWASGRHSGLDFAAQPGTAVLAAAAGRVTFAGYAGRYGKLVTIDHGGAVTYYAHLSRTMVAAGDDVQLGQQIGAVGSTGNATGPHLHFEVHIAGVARDPAAVLDWTAARP